MLRLIASAAAFWVAARFVPGIHYTGSAIALLGVAAVFGVVNGIVAPIVKFFALPAIIVTLGLFLLVINAAMLLLTGALAAKLGLALTIDGFWPALLGSLVISFVASVLTAVFDSKKKND